MKKSFWLFLMAWIGGGFLYFAQADSNYGKYVWKSTLDKKSGVLKVQGAGHNPWQFGWVTVSTQAVEYLEAGTNLGPVIIYLNKSKGWTVVRLQYNTGRLENVRQFSQPVRIIRVGKYGVIIGVGNDVYDYSWNQCKKMAK